MGPDWLLEKLALLGPLLMSLSVHESAHARTALAFGDPTAKNMGRCTLNPLAHLDPVGTLAIMLCGFGWAKPVPVNPYNLHPPKWGNIAVSLAGPLSNLVLGILTALVLRVMWKMDVLSDSPYIDVIWQVGLFTMAANFCLFSFNMIPLYPLDGHHIMREQLPGDMQANFMRWQMTYGRVLLMVLILAPFAIRTFDLPIVSPLSVAFRWIVDTAAIYLIFS